MADCNQCTLTLVKSTDPHHGSQLRSRGPLGLIIAEKISLSRTVATDKKQIALRDWTLWNAGLCRA